MGKEVLEAVKVLAPYLKDIFQMDVSVGICDKTKFIAYYPGHKLDMKIPVGKVVEKGEPMYITLYEGKIANAVVPRDYYGIAFRGIGYPIKDERGEVIGSIGLGLSLESSMQVTDLTGDIFSSLQQMNAIIRQVAEGSESLSNKITDIVNKTKATEEKINKSNETINSIKQVASQSNLLSLNASIEAARAGELGKGFSVVANEMRKLSLLSNESSEDVAKDLSAMSDSMTQILKAINSLEEIAKNQSQNSLQIKDGIDEIVKSMERLVKATTVNE